MRLSPDEMIFWQHGALKLNATIVFTWGLMLVLAVGAGLALGHGPARTSCGAADRLERDDVLVPVVGDVRDADAVRRACEGVDVVLLHPRQHLGRPVVGGAVALVELAAQLVALVERDRARGQEVGRRGGRTTAERRQRAHR